MVLGSGSFVIAVIVGAFSWRIAHLLSVLICPVKTTSCFKRWQKVPTHAQGYTHYANEFDFTCDEEPPISSDQK